MPPFSRAKYQMLSERLPKLIEEDGLQQHKVAGMMGISLGTVCRMCRRLGLKTHPPGPRRGAEHPDWKGGRKKIGGYWYVYTPEHPNATKQRYVAEHRLLMEEEIGRYLQPTEVVHHKNGIRDDNRVENLQIFPTNGDHLKHELTGRIPKWTPDGLRRIREGQKQKSKNRRLKSDGRQRNLSSRDE